MTTSNTNNVKARFLMGFLRHADLETRLNALDFIAVINPASISFDQALSDKVLELTKSEFEKESVAAVRAFEAMKKMTTIAYPNEGVKEQE